MLDIQSMTRTGSAKAAVRADELASPCMQNWIEPGTVASYERVTLISLLTAVVVPTGERPQPGRGLRRKCGPLGVSVAKLYGVI
jgi:hypothetical protein